MQIYLLLLKSTTTNSKSALKERELIETLIYNIYWVAISAFLFSYAAFYNTRFPLKSLSMPKKFVLFISFLFLKSIIYKSLYSTD